jgi:hypothetical protein
MAGVEADAHGFRSFCIAPVVVASSATHTANFFMFLLCRPRCNGLDDRRLVAGRRYSRRSKLSCRIVLSGRTGLPRVSPMGPRSYHRKAARLSPPEKRGILPERAHHASLAPRRPAARPSACLAFRYGHMRSWPPRSPRLAAARSRRRLPGFMERSGARVRVVLDAMRPYILGIAMHIHWRTL